VSNGSNLNYSENARALLKPDEVLNLDPNYLICFVRGIPPILARRILYYCDPFFRTAKRRILNMSTLLWWGLMAGAIGLVVWGVIIKGEF
jgi:type IV secretory pathway TraG/TraD family ATPase VirD4